MEHKVRLSENQKKKINAAFRKGESVSLRLAHEALSGRDKIILTQSQVENLKKAKAAGNGVEITLSKAQLGKQGGILPFLIVPALIAAAKAAALGAAGAAGAAAVKGIADAVQSKKGSGFLKKHRKGRGLFVPGKR
jgi:hypothetical protein